MQLRLGFKITNNVSFLVLCTVPYSKFFGSLPDVVKFVHSGYLVNCAVDAVLHIIVVSKTAVQFNSI